MEMIFIIIGTSQIVLWQYIIITIYMTPTSWDIRPWEAENNTWPICAKNNFQPDASSLTIFLQYVMFMICQQYRNVPHLLLYHPFQKSFRCYSAVELVVWGYVVVAANIETEKWKFALIFRKCIFSLHWMLRLYRFNVYQRKLKRGLPASLSWVMDKPGVLITATRWMRLTLRCGLWSSHFTSGSMLLKF